MNKCMRVHIYIHMYIHKIFTYTYICIHTYILTHAANKGTHTKTNLNK